MAMTKEELAEIRGRVDKATPGPWVEFEGDSPFGGEVRTAENFQMIVKVDDMDDRPEDLEFIANARQDVSALLDEIERLQKIDD